MLLATAFIFFHPNLRILVSMTGKASPVPASANRCCLKGHVKSSGFGIRKNSHVRRKGYELVEEPSYELEEHGDDSPDGVDEPSEDEEEEAADDKKLKAASSKKKAKPGDKGDKPSKTATKPSQAMKAVKTVDKVLAKALADGGSAANPDLAKDESDGSGDDEEVDDDAAEVPSAGGIPRGALDAVRKKGAEHVDDHSGQGKTNSSGRSVKDYRVQILRPHGAAQAFDFFQFRDGVQRLKELQIAKYPIRGPRCFLWGAEFMVEFGGSAMGWDTKWRSDGRLQFTDPGVELHESLCRMIHYGITFDGLNGSSLVSFELMMRELMVVEERHKERFSAPNVATNSIAAERALFLGLPQ